jgi:hypothetical protein
MENQRYLIVICRMKDKKMFLTIKKSLSQDTRSCYVFTMKGKAVPLLVWSGPEDSRKLSFPDFMTTAQDGGKVVSLTHRPLLPPGNMFYYALLQTKSNVTLPIIFCTLWSIY